MFGRLGRFEGTILSENAKVISNSVRYRKGNRAIFVHVPKFNIMNTRFLLLAAAMTAAGVLQAQNPVIRDQFSADPTARVFDGKVYIYPSHDIPSPVDRLKEWFCMADYHVFSSTNLTDWTDHGVILTQNEVSWVQPDSYSMWAPDCVCKDGKYYLYFPSTPKGEGRRGFNIGVSVADHPEGPFTPEA